MTHPQSHTSSSPVYTVWINDLTAKQIALALRDIRGGLLFINAISQKKPIVVTFLFADEKSDVQQSIKIGPRSFDKERRLKRIASRVQRELTV